MKTKNFLLVGIITLAGLFSITSCNNDDDPVAEEAISEEEVVEILSTSLASGTDGVTADIETAAGLSRQSVDDSNSIKSANIGKTLSCGESSDTTFTIQRGSSLITFESSKTYNYMLECDESENPLLLDINLMYEGNLDAPRVASQHSGSADFTVASIEHTSDMYLINGTWKRSGSFESKIRNQGTRQASLRFELIDVAVEKEPKEIDNGTIIFSIEGESASGSSSADYKYEGTITYNGNGEAIIEISGSSSSYITNLETGEVEEL
ncbi:hypothetical protein [Maribellus maritimus]|uniref:hypothetical protein n=1 Tax=Maribellus maritimus TaxID=2870838 RepID=UPI001EECCB09|nr:hypothetical protein [Maribellus maritimus]MCG6189830.1 hypothetical protein [Maribellus maritimus]